VLEEEFVRLVHEFTIRGEFYFGFWAVAGAVESKGPLHRHFYVALKCVVVLPQWGETRCCRLVLRQQLDCTEHFIWPRESSPHRIDVDLWDRNATGIRVHRSLEH
jgi:hypothetical protein